MGNIRRTTLCLVMCVGLAASAYAVAPEKTLGSITLGDPYKNVKAKYAFLPALKGIEETALPYPQNVLDKKPVISVAHPSLNMVLYVDRKTSKIRALATAETGGIALQTFETGAGLRIGDTVQTARLLYGEPLKTSSYVYYFPAKQRVEQRIFYYPDLCLYTRTNGTTEIVTSIVLGKYDVEKTLAVCQQPLHSKAAAAIVPSATPAAAVPTVAQTAVLPKAPDVPAVQAEKRAKKKTFFSKREKEPEVAAVVPTAPEAVSPTVVALPAQPKPVKKKPVEKKQEVLVEQKIEISERVASVSPEFKALIATPEWRFKVRYEEKTSELVVTFRMTRTALNTLIATPEGAPYAQVLEGLFSQL